MAEQYQYWNSRLVGGKILEYVTDKRKSAQSYINYMMIRLQKMFKYDNLPDTIPREMLECYLLQSGSCFITKVNDKLYAFQGTMGGEPDPYYRPTLYIVANPALKFNKSLDLWKDGVLMRNDSLWLGLFPLMARYATMLSENIVTIRSADVMLRVVAMLTAPDDATRTAAEMYIRKLEKGEFSVIGENRFFDGVKLQSPPSNNGSYLTQFIELQQYLKASFYNEIGLNANYNMKREAIMEGESSLNEDSLLPLCDEMLRCRQEDVARVNEMYDTNISVDFDSAWAQNIKELEYELESLKKASQLASIQAGGSNGSTGNDEGDSSHNGTSSGSSNGSDESQSNGAASSSVRNDGRSEGADNNSASDDVSGGGESGESAFRNESGDEEVDAEQSAGAVNLQVNVLVDSQLTDSCIENEGGEADGGSAGESQSDNGADGQGSESGDENVERRDSSDDDD